MLRAAKSAASYCLGVLVSASCAEPGAIPGPRARRPRFKIPKTETPSVRNGDTMCEIFFFSFLWDHFHHQSGGDALCVGDHLHTVRSFPPHEDWWRLIGWMETHSASEIIYMKMREKAEKDLVLLCALAYSRNEKPERKDSFQLETIEKKIMILANSHNDSRNLSLLYENSLPCPAKTFSSPRIFIFQETCPADEQDTDPIGPAGLCNKSLWKIQRNGLSSLDHFGEIVVC